MVSSDFEEVCGVASRAIIFYRGRIIAELSRANLTIGRLIRAALGDATQPSAQYV
jgi:ABC-type sugar transport system ATPase subunit